MIEAVATNFTPNVKEKDCYDCYYCQAAVGWWCVNKDAFKLRGTRFPGMQDCPHWKRLRMKGDLSFWEKLFGDFIWIRKAL